MSTATSAGVRRWLTAWLIAGVPAFVVSLVIAAALTCQRNDGLLIRPISRFRLVDPRPNALQSPWPPLVPGVRPPARKSIATGQKMRTRP